MGEPAGAMLRTETFGMRLRRLREARGLTQADVAEAVGMTALQGHRWEHDQAVPRAAVIDRIASFFEVAPEWLQYGVGGGPTFAAVLGMVGAGQAIVPFDDGPFDQIEVPFGAPPGVIALIVRGDSMQPELSEGDFVLYRGVPQDPATLIGRRCVVRLEDGRVLVKRLRRGAALDTYDLESTNAAPIEGQRLVWCARVEAVVYRK